MEIVANRGVDHARGFAPKRKDVIHDNFSKVEGAALEKLLLATRVPPVEAPLVNHVGLRVDMERDDVADRGHSHLFPFAGWRD